jgi:hypothetical protein
MMMMMMMMIRERESKSGHLVDYRTLSLSYISDHISDITTTIIHHKYIPYLFSPKNKITMMMMMIRERERERERERVEDVPNVCVMSSVRPTIGIVYSRGLYTVEDCIL